MSIIIPCWNAAAYVGEAISSALGQTYPNCEVIVIDDGSTDGSLDVIRSFGDRIRWTTGPNRGGCAARNAGIEMAKGEFIQFLDADDTLHPEKLARQVSFSLEDGDVISFCDHFFVAQEDQSPSVRLQQADESDPVVLVLRHRTMCITAPLHRREAVLRVGGFRVGLPASQEFDLHLRLAVRGSQFRRLPEPLFTVHRRAGSVSSHTGRTLACKLRYLPEAVEQLRLEGQLTPRRRSEFAVHAAWAARLCMRDNLWKEGLELMRFAEELDSNAADQTAYSASSRVMKRMIGPIAVEVLANARRWGKDRVRRLLRGTIGGG